MYKPGDVVIVLKHEKARRQHRLPPKYATVLPGTPTSGKWPVLTTEGEFEETELHQAHPSVLLTAEGRDPADAWRADMEARAKQGGERLPYELRDKIEGALKKASMDLNGHWKSGVVIDKEFKILEHLFLPADAFSTSDAKALLQAAKTKKPLDRWLPLNISLSMSGLSGLRRCSYCGEDDFETETNGTTVRIAGPRCKFPEGLPPTEWELNVPSGKLVVANDLRDLFPLPEDEDFDINGAMGCRQTTLAYAANGMSHAFVGNSCPGVYACSDGTYKIANTPADEKWDGKKYVPVKPAPKFDGKSVANICTDLWWYSICDHDEFKKRLKHFKQKDDFRADIVNVKPGVYRFRHNEGRSHDGPEECVYTRFEWVRDPDPVKDFLSQYEEVEVHAHAYVQAQVAKWPTLFGKVTNRLKRKETAIPWADMREEDRLHSWQRVADHIFCTIGSGTEWHSKGFPTAKVDPTIPDIEPPSFRAQHHWYPFSKPYGGLFEPKTLAPSFAKLAFRILESVISFGTDVRDGERSREVPYVRERMLVAVKRYRELAKQYPDLADPEYVAWLGQKGRAEAWVERFDLGPVFTEKHREHVKCQRWVPEDAYAVEFDARKLKEGHFAWHPKKNGGCWANKKDAERYAINQWEDNGKAPEHNCFWTCHATNTSVPLYTVARVVKVGEVSHMGSTLIEIAFDYGTPWMRDQAKRKALGESAEKAGIRVLTREEYEALLPKAEQSFKEEG